MPLVNRNKRIGPDLTVKSKRVFIVLAWIFMFAFFLAFSVAKPRMTTMFDRFYDVTVFQGIWNRESLATAMYFMIPAAICSAIGLVLNARRHNRKYDKYSKSLIIFFILSATAIVFFFFL